uniref:Uncharacterized protein n=1 Tax=Romanomermis culicivorax TaxID=13658 RepID=A0A915HT07_ROMCU
MLGGGNVGTVAMLGWCQCWDYTDHCTQQGHVKPITYPLHKQSRHRKVTSLVKCPLMINLNGITSSQKGCWKPWIKMKNPRIFVGDNRRQLATVAEF